jgi:hypothetical protein
MRTEKSGSKAKDEVQLLGSHANRKFDSASSCLTPGITGSSRQHWLILILIILLFASIRFRLREYPLERDEGEYAYAGQLMLQGLPPYELAYNMKFPGIYAAYAVILAIFGQSAGGIHCGVLVVTAATTFLVYLLGARLFNGLAGVISSAAYALLSTSPSVLGISGHANHFVVFLALAGILLLLRAAEKGDKWLFVLSGILLGLAFLMKQHGIFFLLFAALYLLMREPRSNPTDIKALGVKEGCLVLGALAPSALTILILLMSGVFDRFWFWTIVYAREYISAVSFWEGMRVLRNAIPIVTGHSAFLWFIAALGPLFYLRHPRLRASANFVIGYILFSFFAVCPGFFFRPHYFLLLVPAAALSIGLAVSSANQYFKRKAAIWGIIPILIFLFGYSYSLARQSAFFFVTSPTKACRQIYGSEPFPESVYIAQYLKNHAPKDSRIAVLGSEPQIYFYSGLRSATGYIYTYGLMEEHRYALGMQKEMISEIEAARPEYMVYVHIRKSWIPWTGSHNLIFTWARQYLEQQYDLKGVVDIPESGETKYLWDANALSYKPGSEGFIEIFKRKETELSAVKSFERAGC